MAGTFGRTAPSVSTGSHGPGTHVVAGVGERLSFRLSQPDGDLYAGGVYEHEPSQLFASAGFGIRNDFFGLDERYDYDRTLGYEANAGHRNLFFRVSRQLAEGRGKRPRPVRRRHGDRGHGPALLRSLGGHAVRRCPEPRQVCRR